MSEKDLHFDRQMMEHLSEIIPPEEEIKAANPWSRPIGLITWGLIYKTLKLNFLYLQYILPVVGAVFIYLGFRSLKNENKYFRLLWVLSIFILFLQLAELVLISTPLNIMGSPSFAPGMAITAFQISVFLIFHNALKETYKKAGKPMEDSPLIWVSVWTAAVFLIALSPLSASWLVFIPMIIFYVLIVRALFRIGEELDDTGYILVNAPVRVNGKVFGRAYFLTALALVTACGVYYNHLKLEPQKYRAPNASESRQRLLDMGFPSDALYSLGDQDADMLAGAVNVEASSKLLMFDPKKIEHRSGSEGHVYITHDYEPGKKNLESTAIYIEMPGNTVYVMQYFTWRGGNPLWQDGFIISGASGAQDKEIISGGLFYSKNGVQYTAGFPRLVCEKSAVSTMFGTDYPITITGALSYPFGSKDRGGYVLYRYTSMSESNAYIAHANFSYVHISNPLRIPYARTEDMILAGAYMFEDMLAQQYTTYESLALKEAALSGD